MRNLVALGFVFALLTTGCSDDTVDPGYGLVSDLVVKSVVPERFTPGELTTLTLLCEVEHSGLARVHISGHGGGSDVGEMKSPVEARIGSTIFPLPMDAGKTVIPMEIEMLLDLDPVGFSVTVTLDSLLADGSLVHWRSDEGKDLYEGDIPAGTAFLSNTSFLHVDVYRADSE